jgi:hypothetical protein
VPINPIIQSKIPSTFTPTRDNIIIFAVVVKNLNQVNLALSSFVLMFMGFVLFLSNVVLLSSELETHVLTSGIGTCSREITLVFLIFDDLGLYFSPETWYPNWTFPSYSSVSPAD